LTPWTYAPSAGDIVGGSMMADGEEDGPFDLGHAGRGERGAERLRIDAPLQQRGEPLAQQHRWL